MNQLLEWLPLLAFFIGFKLFDIYTATAVLMVAFVLQLVVHRLHTGQFKTLHWATTSVAVVLGSATLLFHDKRFIQLKPTILLGLTALVFLGSAFIGKQPLARRALESVFPEPLEVSTRIWSRLNYLWVGWFVFLALANLYVAHNFSESVWVNVKVFGITIAMMLFMMPQVLWLFSKRNVDPPEPPLSG